MKVLIHEQPARQVQDILRARGGSFIFHGAPEVGKRTIATDISRRLNCLGDEPKTCPSCRQHLAGTYPDLVNVSSEDKPSISIETIRSVVQSVSLSLYHAAGVRVIIIDDAHLMTAAAQNALLKVLEEPPAQTMFILVTDQPRALLPTIHSRCAPVYFPSLASTPIAELLASDYAQTEEAAALIAAASDGAPGTAIQLVSSPDVAAERRQLQELADGVAQKNLFDRLLLVKKLVDSKTDPTRFGRLLHRSLVAQTRAAGSFIPDAPKRFQALEKFRRAVDAKVAPRVALERLMLEL